MRHPFRNGSPSVDPSAFVSEQAALIGDVTVGERASVFPFVCARADGGPVTVGERSNVQEFAMLHGARIGDGVTVGHGATVDYAAVEGPSLVGINSVVLQGATVESGCLVAAGTVVLPDQTVPTDHFAVGAPAEVRPITAAQRSEIERVRDHYDEIREEYREAFG